MVITYTLILTNTILFILISCNVLDYTEFASSFYLNFEKKQYARIVMSTFTHKNFLHIFCNMYTLWSYGTVMEPLLGSGKMLIAYLSTGIIGGMQATAIRQLTGKGKQGSIGASGCICGIMGIYLVYIYFSAGSYSIPYLVRTITPMLLLSFSPRIDGMAHICCMLCGAVFGLLFLV